MIALLVAAKLVSLQKQKAGTAFNTWIASALIGMGLLDIFHAVVHAGNAFVWLHSIATFVGGVLFLMVWFPKSWELRASGWFHWVAAAGAIALGASSILFHEMLPPMVRDGKFTFPSKVLNIAGGCFLFIAAVQLIKSYLKTRNVDDLLFCLHCLLFGAAAIMFEQSQLWDASWWGWHVLRLLAYGVALWFVVLSEQQTSRKIAAQLEQANIALEQRVEERTSQLVGINEQLAIEVHERIEAEQAREKIHQRLIDVSHKAGMAEMATGVLHNVGNVLNSVNIAAQLVIEKVKEPHVANLAKAVAVMDEHTDNLAEFITSHPRGQHLPRFLRELSGQLMSNRDAVLKNLGSLSDNVDHIKEIVHVQQSHAKVGGVVASFDLSDVVEDALKMNNAGLIRHGVAVHCDFEPSCVVVSDRNKILQILVNLISNAKYAVSSAGMDDGHMSIRIALHGENRIRVEVADNGVGISPVNMIKIFQHGFTTKSDGHGFGLHASALAAKELGGALNVYSEGPGQGAVFTLELPAQIEEAVPCIA